MRKRRAANASRVICMAVKRLWSSAVDRTPRAPKESTATTA
jgi:hypothetical protein